MGSGYSNPETTQDEKTYIFTFRSYKFEHDALFKHYETDLNLFKYIELTEFQQILYNFNSNKDDKIDKKDDVPNEYDYHLSKLMFTVFIDKKIINHFLVYPNIADDERILKQSIAFYAIIFEHIYKNYKIYLKKFSKDKRLKLQNNKIRKLCLLSMAFLYCRVKNVNHRLLFIYNLFADDNREIENSPDIDMFFFFVLLHPSLVFLSTMVEMGEEFEGLKLSEEKTGKMEELFDVQNVKSVLEVVLEKIFLGEQKIGFEQFSANLGKMDWLFSPSGIRRMLQEGKNGKLNVGSFGMPPVVTQPTGKGGETVDNKSQTKSQNQNQNLENPNQREKERKKDETTSGKNVGQNVSTPSFKNK